MILGADRTELRAGKRLTIRNPRDMMTEQMFG